MALVETRSRTFRPSASEMKVTLHRFGRNRRLVLIFEWLTLWPTSEPLAVSSQRRDIALNPLPSRPSSLSEGAVRGSKSRPSREPRTYRGRASRFAPPAPPPERPFLRAFRPTWPSYKRRIRRRHHGCRECSRGLA